MWTQSSIYLKRTMQYYQTQLLVKNIIEWLSIIMAAASTYLIRIEFILTEFNWVYNEFLYSWDAVIPME